MWKSPDVSRALAAKVRERGADMVDSPVSGSVITLQEGKLSVMVGGRRETFEKIKPLLLDIGPKVTYVGDNGLALSMKIATNLSLAVQMLAFSEGVLLAEKSGIAREVAVDVLTHSAVASPMIQYRGPFVLQQPEKAILETGGAILVAMQEGRLAGTVALKKADSATFELTKMAVAEEFRGNGLGKELVRAAIGKATSLGAKRIILETGPRQPDAIAMYKHAGFVEIPLYGEYIGSQFSVCMAKDL